VGTIGKSKFIDQLANKRIINKTDLNNPVEINFAYKHKVQGEKNYKVPCFVILLHN